MRRGTRVSRSLRQLLSCHGPTAYGSGVTGCARTRAPAEERRAAGGPRKRRSRGVGRSPTLVRNAARSEDFALIAPAAELPRPDGIRERRNGLRADARACEGAARGVGGPRKRRSRGVGRSPTLVRNAARNEDFALI